MSNQNLTTNALLNAPQQSHHQKTKTALTLGLLVGVPVAIITAILLADTKGLKLSAEKLNTNSSFMPSDYKINVPDISNYKVLLPANFPVSIADIDELEDYEVDKWLAYTRNATYNQYISTLSTHDYDSKDELKINVKKIYTLGRLHVPIVYSE